MLSKCLALISAFILTLHYVGVVSERPDFITMGIKSHSATTAAAAVAVQRKKAQQQQIAGRSVAGRGYVYTLRYRPGFFLNKLAPQAEPAETTTKPAATVSPTEPTETEPTIPTRPVPVEPDPPIPTRPSVPGSMGTPTDMIPTMEMPGSTAPPAPPTKKPSRPTPAIPTPSSTRISIMRPQSIPSKIGNALKQLFFTTPGKLNLIQKRPHAAKTKGKGFLSLFEVIKFANIKCSVSMSDIRSMEGVCYHEFECKSLGGIPTESCADGVGVCCIFLNGCGQATSQSIVYFESPNYPQAVREMMVCVLIVNVRKHVQQLRLDFQMFELSRPTNGDCEDDQFIVSGHKTNFQIPILCGINTGQHIYVHVGDSTEGKVYLSVFVKVSSGGRSFNIKISQLENELAPDNCLQYFTDTEGVIKSFNYDVDGSVVDNREATYFNNLNYAVCLARGKNVCSVSYNTDQLGGDQPDFQIINKDEAEADLVSDGQAGAGIFNCPDDFLSINSVRLCGERFNDGINTDDFTMHATVKDVAAGPIVLPFRTDAEYVGRGFRLLYRQELCA